MTKIGTLAILLALASPAAADDLPAIYLGTWCGNGDDILTLKVGNERCEGARTIIRRNGLTFYVDDEIEDCRFKSIRKTGRSWPVSTKPMKGDWVPEVDITTKCADGSTLKYRLIWLKGGQLNMW
jgi:hypothetical protein